MKRIILIIPAIFYFSFLLQAQENIENRFSVDLSYSLTALVNHGWGIGLIYEIDLLECLSVKGGLGHMTVMTGIDEVYNTSVGVSLFINYFPFNNIFDKFYFSAGSGCDFMNYFGDGELPTTKQDTLIHVTPQIGWKFHVLNYLIIDVSIGYKFIIYNTHNYYDVQKYINPGFQFGIGIKLFLKSLIRELFDE